MLGRISLANKCLILFGLAVVLIIVAALLVPWLRMNTMVDDAEVEVSRQMVEVWERTARGVARTSTSGPTELIMPGDGVGPPAEVEISIPSTIPSLRNEQRALGAEAILNVLLPAQVGQVRSRDAFIRSSWDTMSASPAVSELSTASWGLASREYRYARAVRDGANQLEGLIVLTRTSQDAAGGMWLNTIYLFSAGFVALGMAVLVFYLITSKIILSPVRSLRETAEEVRQGNFDIRSEIATGDEFEDLAETFNDMVGAVQQGQAQLRMINTSLDEQVNQLAERNLALYESSRVKDEFLASVTHELRTPLNSILGFAELLEEQVLKDVDTDYDAVRLNKRRRYVENIQSSGKTLLDLVTGLLEMAKMEAGKANLKLRVVDLKTLGEQMMVLMKPQADKRGVDLRFEVPESLPTIVTDAGKLQQVLFNLLSNAVKFTGDALDEVKATAMASAAIDGSSTPATIAARQSLALLRIEHLPARGGEGPGSAESVRISVLDTGPGIAPEDQKRIFEKFTQLDSGITRRHAGTGLGLYICKQLTTLLKGEIMVHSEVSQGSMFSIILPMAIDAAKPGELVGAKREGV